MKWRELTKRLRSLFLRSELFLVIVVSAETVRATAFRVWFEKKHVRLVREAYMSLAHCTPEDVRVAIIALLKRMPKQFRESRVILSLHPTLGTTIHSAVELERDTPKDPIDEADLDQRVAQAIWRLFDSERSRAAVKMGIVDIDVALFDVRVKRVRLDGHGVMNPLGFTARTIELALSQTFCAKTFMEEMRALFPKVKSLSIVESGMATAELITRIEKHAPFLFAEIGEQETFLYVATGREMMYRDALQWGAEGFFEALGGAFAVDPATARRIMDEYLAGRVSPRMATTIARILFNEFQILGKGIGVHLGTIRRAYLSASFPLPSFLFAPRFAWHIPSRPRILPAGRGLIEEALGFRLDERGMGTDDRFTSYAALFSFYFSPEDDTMDAIARRHARWLITR